MENILSIRIELIMVAVFIIYRIHIWRIRQNYNRFLIKQQESKEGYDLTDVVNSSHKLFELQELGQLDYFLLILLTLIIFFKN